MNLELLFSFSLLSLSSEDACFVCLLFKRQCDNFVICLLAPVLCARKRPSIYDVHTEEEWVRLRWTHVDGGGSSPCGRPHRKLKLESTDVILLMQRSWRL